MKKTGFAGIITVFTCISVAVLLIMAILPAEENGAPAAFKVDINVMYLSRIGISFGELKTLLGDCEYEFTHAGLYVVRQPGTNVYYQFDGYDPDTSEWVASDDNICTLIQAPLGEFVPDMPRTISVYDFALSINADRATATVKEGAMTAWYIADKYAQIDFTGNADANGESDFRARLEIELDANVSDDTKSAVVTRDSIAWLKIPCE